MAIKVLKTETRTVGGSVTMPNGFTDYNRIPMGATGPGWSATTSASVTCDNCSAGFFSGGPEWTHSSDQIPYAVSATIQIGGASATVDYHDAPARPPYAPHINGYGRGFFGDTITGSFSWSTVSELYVESFGEIDLPDDPIPDDYYPRYGGARIVGEYPTNYGILRWRGKPGATCTGTITFGDRSASCTGPAEFAPLTDYCAFSIQLMASIPANESTGSTPGGVISASINLNGYPVQSDGVGGYFDGIAGGKACTAKVGAGFVTVTNDTTNGHPAPGSYGGISSGGFIFQTKRAQIELDAYAMDQPHPNNGINWKILRKYKWVEDAAPGAPYGYILDEGIPIWETFVGQAVSAAVEQRREELGFVIQNKDVGDKHLDPGATPMMGPYGVVDHYRNDQGPVMAYIVPPAGEPSQHWRVGFRGKAGGGLTVSREGSVPLSLPSGTEDGDGNVTYTWGSPRVFEGYRYLAATPTEAGGATGLLINGKTYGVGNVDLCFPTNGGVWTDRQDTRYPLNAERKSTIETPLWGLTNVSQIKAIGGSLSSLALVGLSKPARIHALAPFLGWVQEVPDDLLQTADGDDYTVEHDCIPGVSGDSSGRWAVEFPHVRRTINNAPHRLYTTDYAHLSCGGMAALFSEVPGWSATGVTDEGDDPPAWFAVQGYVRNGGGWTKQWDQGAGTIVAQPIYDSMFWPGDVGDVFGTGGGTLTLAGRWVSRSSAMGPTDKDGALHYSDVGGGAEGSGGSSDKRYLVGPSLSAANAWGEVWTNPAHKAGFGATRRVQWGAFYVPAAGGKVLAVLARGDGRLFRVVDVDGTANLGATDVPGRATWDDRSLDTSATDASLTRGRGERVVNALVSDGTLTLRIEASEGRTAPLTTMTEGSATSADVAAYGDGAIAVVRIDGGQVKITLRNARDLSLIDGPHDTNVTGLGDGATVRAAAVRRPGNKPALAILVNDGGATTTYLTTDCKVLTP